MTLNILRLAQTQRNVYDKKVRKKQKTDFKVISCCRRNWRKLQTTSRIRCPAIHKAWDIHVQL